MKFMLEKEDKECIENIGFLYVNCVGLGEPVKTNKGYKIDWENSTNGFKISKNR